MRYALLPAAALLVGAAILGLVLVNRGEGAGGRPTPTPSGGPVAGGNPSPPPTRGASPSPGPTQSPPPPLLAVGQQRSLTDLPPITLPVDESKCPGVRIVWRLRSIAAEASGRVTVAYSVQVPRVSGVPDCRVSLNPDKNCRCWALQTRLGSGRVDETLISGGSGVADTGGDDIYGREPLTGAWTFDNTNLAGTELTLLFFVDDGVLLHRQPLIGS